MMRLRIARAVTLLLVSGMLWWPAVGQAQSITIDLGGTPITLSPSAQQLTDLQTIVDAHNAQNETTLTREQFVRNIMLIAPFQSYRKQLGELESIVACANFNKASQAVKDSIIAALGGSPCP